MTIRVKIDMSTVIETVQFSGTRLTEAREAMGLYVNNLAELIGVTRSMVSAYESGKKKPSEQTFARICTVLNQPPRFFYYPNREFEFKHGAVHYRDLVKNSLYSRAQAGVRLKWLMEYFSILECELNLPLLNIPDFEPPSDPALITDSFIECIAIETRKFWKLGDAPIPNLVDTLERNGVVIGQICLDLPDLDGLSFWSNTRQRPFILLNADKATCVRSRFDLAHELGHMLLHKNITDGIDKKSPIYRRAEEQAHLFASALLLPRSSWVRDIRNPSKVTLGTFKTLKPKWKTSIKAQIMRLFKLNLIDKDKKESLYKQYGSKPWARKEPFDDLWVLEKPKLFMQATKMLAEHGFGADFIVQMFPLRSENLSEITGLPKTFFDNSNLPMQLNSAHAN